MRIAAGPCLLMMIAFLIRFHNPVEGVEFSFVEFPTNITINDTAVYQCYVDIMEGVTIQWQVNGTQSTSEKITELGIVTTGLGTSNSSVSIPGTERLAGSTIVTCIASGFVNGKLYINSSSATLYVQGKPEVDLKCNLQTFFTINCEWKKPEVVSGFHITKYIIKDSIQDLEKILLNDTLHHMYDASVIGKHQVAIIPYIEDLEGKLADELIEIDTDWITNHQAALSLQNRTWTLVFELNTKNSTYMYNPPPQEVRGCIETDNNTNESYCPFNGTTNASSTNQITGELPLESLDNKRSNITIKLVYSSGIQFRLNDLIELNTFDVQNGSVSIEGPNKVCFTCTFIDGSDAIGCQVVYTDKDSRELDKLNITRMDDYMSALRCNNSVADTTKIEAVLFYDIESDGSVSTTVPALQLSVSEFSVHVHAGDHSIHSVVVSTRSASHIVTTATTASPTEPLLESGPTTSTVIAAIIVTIIGVVLIVVAGMIVAFMVKNKKKPEDEFSTRRAAIAVNDYDQQFTNTSTAMHTISVNVVSNNDTYSRLDHSVTASSHQQHGSSDIYHKLDRSIKPEQQCLSVYSSEYSTLSNVLMMESRVDERASSIDHARDDAHFRNLIDESV